MLNVFRIAGPSQWTLALENLDKHIHYYDRQGKIVWDEDIIRVAWPDFKVAQHMKIKIRDAAEALKDQEEIQAYQYDPVPENEGV